MPNQISLKAKAKINHLLRPKKSQRTEKKLNQRNKLTNKNQKNP